MARFLSPWPSLDEWRQGQLRWLSPLAPSYHEFRDDFWSAVGLPPPTPQGDGWWPSRGPVWDAAAEVPGPDGQLGIVLVEAKGRPGELADPGCRAKDEQSRRRIRESIHDVQADLKIAPRETWLQRYYQTANRLAFLWYTRCRRQDLPVWLAWVYFLGDRYRTVRGEQQGPTTAEEWEPHIDQVKAELSLPDEHKLSPFQRSVFVPAREPPGGRRPKPRWERDDDDEVRGA